VEGNAHSDVTTLAHDQTEPVGGQYTLRIAIAVRIIPPPVPVIVRANWPLTTLLTVITVELEPVTVDGLKLAVGPDWEGVITNATAPLKPKSVTATVYCPLPCLFKLKLAGDAEIVKFDLTTCDTVFDESLPL
jgi:hypothetical protein